MLNQMTVEEKTRMRSGDFNLLWQAIWGKPPLPQVVAAKVAVDVNQYRSEELTSRDKYKLLYDGITVQQQHHRDERHSKRGTVEPAQLYTLNDLIDQSDPGWSEPEWGFPKGRRNPQESDYDCALREFTEETGISAHLHLQNIQNLMPYEEIFTGSNYKSYKHKYYVMLLNDDQYDIALDTFETSEVSLVSWKTLEEARQCIRPYNLEKLRILDHVDRTMKKFPIMMTKCLSFI
jgi:8-oxo-dGTP pyrophosphatase MutT (NUDIX family)